jgi:hypothetical protein
VGIYSGQVSQSSDDASQNGTGAAGVITGVTIPLGQHSGAAGTFFAGFRFQNVTIPQGATIGSASISPNFAGATNTGISTMLGEAADNSATFGTSTNNISGRSTTTNTASWDTSTVASSGFQPSPDLTAIIQEIVNRSGWASGNALSILFQTSHATISSGVVNTYDQSPSDGATILVGYSTTAGIYPGTMIGGGSSVPGLIGLPRGVYIGASGGASSW